MSERERDLLGVVPEDRGAEKPNLGGDPADFLRLVREANDVSGEDREKLVGQLIDVLIAMRAPGNERAEAKAVLGQLDLKALTGMVDPMGRSARHEAVETVLSLGFPYALAVPPEDLAFAREQEAQGDRLAQRLPSLDFARNAAALLGGASAVGQAAMLAQAGIVGGHPSLVTGATLGATAAWATWLRSRLGKPALDYLPGVLGIVLGLGTVFTTAVPDVPTLVAAFALFPIIGGVLAIGSAGGHAKNPE